MNYLLLVYENQQALASLSASERQRQSEVVQLTDELLRASGRLLTGAQCSTRTGVITLVIQENELTLTANSFVEAGLQLSAFYSITASDLNDAIQVAAHLPQLQHGAIEVHPLSG